MYDTKQLVQKTIVLLALGSMFTFFVALYAEHGEFVTNMHWDDLQDVYLPAWTRSVDTPPTSTVPATSIPVLIYHGALENPDGYSILTKDFVEQMYALKAAGWRTVKTEDLVAFNRGEKELPAKSFLLTFDDGRKDSLYPVDPVLKALDFNAVMYVITRFSIGDDARPKYYLDEKELRRMVKSGHWELQSHGKDDHVMIPVDQHGTKNYYLTNKMWLMDQGRLETDAEYVARINEDLRISKQELEDAYGVKVSTFAYPFGQYGANVGNVKNAEELISAQVAQYYDAAFYQANVGRGNAVIKSGENSLNLPRIEVGADWTPENLLAVLDATQEKELPYIDDAKSYHGWLRRWGDLSLKDGMYELQVTPDATTAFTVLDGSEKWKDYSFTSRIMTENGVSVSIASRVTRNKQDEDFVYCLFDGQRASLRLRKNGEESRVVDTEFYHDMGTSSKVDITSKGNEFSCVMDGRTVIAPTVIPDAPAQGGIGLKIWHPELGRAKVIIDDVSAEPLTAQ